MLDVHSAVKLIIEHFGTAQKEPVFKQKLAEYIMYLFTNKRMGKSETIVMDLPTN